MMGKKADKLFFVFFFLVVSVLKVNASSYIVIAFKLVGFVQIDVHVKIVSILLQRVVKMDVVLLLFKIFWIDDLMHLM
jgi:hypothetical protein